MPASFHRTQQMRPNCRIKTRSQASVALDGLDYARHWTRSIQTAAHLLEHGLLVFRQRVDRRLADYLHDLVTARLELLEQLRHRFGGRMLEVMHQDNAFAVLPQLGHHRLDDLLRLAHFEVERVHISGEDSGVAFADIFHHFRRVTERREAEERSDRLIAERYAYRRDAHLDLGLGLVVVQLRQILVRPSVGADGMAGLGNFLEQLGVVTSVLADGEEHCLGAVFSERLQHTLGVARPWAVVESEYYLLVAQEVIDLEVPEPKARGAGGVDLHDALDAKRIRIFTLGLRGSRRWRSRSGRSLGILRPGSGGRRRH